MISRLWHGWTKSGHDADAYETMLRTHILPGIGRVAGYRGAHLLRRDSGAEVEFITITMFDDLESVKRFAGADYTRAVIHPDAAKLLTHYDGHSAHYETTIIQSAG
jgi:heme-degrading monooxygenase HmoA